MRTPHESGTRRGARRGFVVALTSAAVIAPAVAAPAMAEGEVGAEALDCSTVPWMDTSLSAGERADALLDASSQHQIYRWLVEQPANSPTQTEWAAGNVRDGHPSDALPVVYPAQVDCTPTVVYTDGPDGVRFTTGVTAFPSTLGLAASFDTDLAERKGAAQADEAFDKGKNVILAPGLASGRTPLSGRTPEYLGEDPVLTGLMAAAAVTGIEDSNDPDKAVLSDLKHYVANEQELDRQTSSSNMDDRTFREIYSLPFEITVDQADPASIMCSYNQVNGVYACENPMLQDVLKDDVGFDGYVMSDFGSVHSTAASLMAGMDQELNRPRWLTPARLDDALAAGEITQERIEEAAKRVIVAYIGGGLFDNPLPTTLVDDASTADHKKIALEMAQKGSVLLTNDGTLPLSQRKGRTIALIGPTASSTATGGINASSVCALPWRFSGGTTLLCEDMVAPLDAMTAEAAERGQTVVFDDGSDPARAAATAASADVAIVFGYKRVGEFSDPADLSLDGGGDALIEAVAGANDDTVVVLTTGTAVEMPWVDDVAAVLEMWYPGEVFGPALASLAYGEVSPSGRLPMTFPASIEDGPLLTDEQYPGVFADGSTVRPTGSTEIRQVNYTEGLEVGYRWWEANDVEPLFEFGHGLTYSSFKYTGVRADFDKVKVKHSKGKHRWWWSVEDSLEVDVTVKNTGRTTATEVVQVYVELPSRVGEPSKRLAGWERVTVKPGKTAKVTLEFSEQDLENLHVLDYFSESKGEWVTPSGIFTVHAGGSVDTAVRDHVLIR